MRTMQRLICGLLMTCGTLATAQTESPYVRVVDTDDGAVRLDVAVRTLVPINAAGPIVHLVGAIHIADAPFYTNVQSFLDVHDVVLYEGVGGGLESVEEPTGGDEAAALTTARRLVFLAMLSDVAAIETGQRPRSTEDLADTFGGAVRDLVSTASRDGWGRDVLFDADGFDAVSLGADAKVGGTGADSDIHGRALLDNPPVIVPDPAAAGLQRDLADALGLTFQLDGIDYSHPNWRNSDMNFAEIQEALGGPPATEARPGTGDGARQPRSGAGEPPEKAQAAEALFKTLSGESFLAKVSGFLLKTLGSSPQGRALVKIMLAETLTQAEALLGAQPGPLGDLMDVIIEDRNRTVIGDLRDIIRDEPGVKTVAIFYGAGHFGDLEARINDDLGYEYEGTLWIPAMTINLENAGLNAAQVGMYRTMMRRMLESQLKAVKKD
ncbi:MAG: hypothetical protein Q9O74_09670 [Planctomycetota bacterium]|nr:hypothetical protein [Planctomycetota bacterium]